MKKRLNIKNHRGMTFTALILAVVLAVTVTVPLTLTAKEKKTDIYDPALDVKTAIKTSVETAKKDNKHVMLIFGGNWCPWCHRLHETLHTDAAIKKFMAENYILVMVDVGETADKPLNRDLVSFYRVKNLGYPSIVVLGQTGELLSVQNSGILEKGKGHDPARVLAFLTAQAPN